MEDGVKNRIMLAVSILCVIFLLLAMGFGNELAKYKKNFNTEMRKRMDAEEYNINFQQEKASFEDNLNRLNSQLEQEKLAHEDTKKAFSQEELVNKSIKEELEKVTRLKETLEDDLKDELMKNPVPRK